MKYIKYYDTPFKRVKIIEEDNKIIRLSFDEKDNFGEFELKDTELLNQTTKQLDEYFEGKRKKFELSLNPSGTEFMKKVWKALEEIPYGETKSYKQIAETIKNPKASRAVGMANNKNPIPIIIPCHRVIGANGELVGYALGLEMKKLLLELEKGDT